ncbi:DUF1559 family PulG-like putative transporter [Singulisphaera rosea]
MSIHFEDDPEFHEIPSKPSSGRGPSIARILAIGAAILILIALLLPANRVSRGAARRIQCMNNLKQIALALQGYEQIYKALPPAYTVDANGRPLHSWRTLILPYLDATELYQSIDLTKPWNDPANAKAFESAVSVYHCPESRGPHNTTTYLASTGPNGCLSPGKPRPLAEITDPHRSTLMVIEAGEENVIPWMAPVDADDSLVLSLGPTTKLHHPGITNACFVDGHVRSLKVDTPPRERRALVSIAGNDNESFSEW